MNTSMILQGQQLSLQLNQHSILRQLDIEVRPGELLGLIGPNGAGKTSLLRILAGLQTADQGTVRLDDSVLNAIDRKQLAQTIAYLEQGAPAHWPLRVRRIVELGRLPYLNPWEKLSSRDSEIVDHAMAQAEVHQFADRTVNTLSGGERLRVLIARMFATQANILLADEPIAALDPYHQLHTMELFRNHCDRGGSAVIVMHDLNMAARFCHRLALLHEGQIVAEGAPEQVLSSQQLAAVYGIHSEILNNPATGLTVIAKSRIPHQPPTDGP